MKDMTKNTAISLEAMNKFFYWSMNFEHNFIERIWGPATPFSMSAHLKSKFSACYDAVGSYGCINSFYGELDNTNRQKLLEYILNNYNDECKLSLNPEEN